MSMPEKSVPGEQTVFPLHSGAKGAYYVVGGLLCILIITIPVAIYIIIRASQGKVILTHQGITATSIGTKKINFNEVQRVGICRAPIYAKGIGGAIARKKCGGDEGINLCFKLQGRKKTYTLIISMYENFETIIEQTSKIVGKPIEEVKIGALKLKWPEQASS